MLRSLPKWNPYRLWIIYLASSEISSQTRVNNMKEMCWPTRLRSAAGGLQGTLDPAAQTMPLRPGLPAPLGALSVPSTPLHQQLLLSLARFREENVSPKSGNRRLRGLAFAGLDGTTPSFLNQFL